MADATLCLLTRPGCGGETAGRRHARQAGKQLQGWQHVASKPVGTSGKPDKPGKPAQTRRPAFCLLPAARGKQKPARTRRPALPFLSSTAHASNPPTAHTTAATHTADSTPSHRQTFHRDRCCRQHHLRVRHPPQPALRLQRRHHTAAAYHAPSRTLRGRPQHPSANTSRT